jgi:hypothetical protein
MRHTKSSWLAMLSLSLLSHAAIAQSGFYLFGAIGNADADVDAGTYRARLKRIRGDESSFALGGGYEFNKNISLEAAYQDFGKLTGDRSLCVRLVCTLEAYPLEAVDAEALAVSALASFRISDRLDGYGKLGLTNWEFHSMSSAYDDSGRDLHYGAGLRWTIDNDWRIFADYTRTDIGIDAVAIGVKYGF